MRFGLWVSEGSLVSSPVEGLCGVEGGASSFFRLFSAIVTPLLASVFPIGRPQRGMFDAVRSRGESNIFRDGIGGEKRRSQTPHIVFAVTIRVEQMIIRHMRAPMKICVIGTKNNGLRCALLIAGKI